MKKALFVFFLFTCNVNAQNADTRWLQKIYGTPGQSVNVTAEKFLSSTAKPLSLALPAGLLIAGFSAKNKKLQYQGWQALGGFVIGSAVTQVTKRVVLRNRPFAESPALFIARIEGEDPSYSFPSGHTTVAFSTATMLALNYRKWYITVPAFAWAGAVGYSRMRLGVHYPSDIFAGALTGAAGAWLSYKIQQRWLAGKRRKPIP
ncbi:MAG: phosphatase PAP2 family protein [Spirosomataceae bacterium]